MLEYIIAGSVYVVSILVLLFLDYKVKKAITVQDILIAITPLVSTIALLLGIVSLIRNWYKENKNKVIIANKNKPKTAKKVTPVIPVPNK